MAGFKEGNVDGWDAEDDDPAPDSSAPDDRIDASDDRLDASESGSVQSETGSRSGSESRDRSSGPTSSDIPWVLRRNTITDGREQTVQLHLQQNTLDTQRRRKTTIEDRLGESVRKADLREAALLVGLQHTDDVVDVLEEWGYALE